MSRAVTPSSMLSSAAETATAKKAIVDIQADITEAFLTLGYMPVAMQTAIRLRFYDLLSHHRLTVLKNHKLPSGRTGQQWLASRMYRYTKTTGGKLFPINVVGEGFAVDIEDWQGQVNLLERGGTRTSQRPMLIPIGAGDARGPGLRPSKKLQDAKANKSGAFITTPRGQTFLVQSIGGTRAGIGAKTEILGVLSKRQTYRPMLGFQRAFDIVVPRHVEKFSADMDLAITESGREALMVRSGIASITNRARIDAMRKYLEQSPGDFRGATRVANRVVKSIRTEVRRTVRANVEGNA